MYGCPFRPLVVGIEMLLIQFLSHRAFLLTWNFPAPPLSEVIDLSDRAQVLAKIDELKLTFTVHHDEIQAKVADTAAPRLLAAPAPVPAAPPLMQSTVRVQLPMPLMAVVAMVTGEL